MLILLSLVNWDNFIVTFNITHPKLRSKIELDYLLTRSDKTLSIIDMNRSQIQDLLDKETIYNVDIDRVSLNEFLNYRIAKFKNSANQYTWLSWNYADYQAYQHFADKK